MWVSAAAWFVCHLVTEASCQPPPVQVTGSTPRSLKGVSQLGEVNVQVWPTTQRICPHAQTAHDVAKEIRYQACINP